MIEIPVSNFKLKSSDFEQILDFDNVSITIRLTYNTRVDYWFATFTINNNSIKNVKLVTNTLLLNQHKATLTEIVGDFIVQRIADDLTFTDLNYDNFGIDWAFQYLNKDEVSAYKLEWEII